MIKIFSDKIGTIHIEEKYLINSLQDLIKFYFNKSSVLDVTVDIKKNVVESVNIFFDKKILIPRKEEKNLFNEILFVLSNKFGINNSRIAFVYENRS